MTSSHKQTRKSLALLRAIESGTSLSASKKKNLKDTPVIRMPIVEPIPFSVVQGTTPEKNTISNGWPLIVSYRCAGSAPDERW